MRLRRYWGVALAVAAWYESGAHDHRVHNDARSSRLKEIAMTHSEKPSVRARVLAAAFVLSVLGVGSGHAADVKVTLSGANEVPPVTTSATGGGTIMIGDDGSVSGSVSTKGVEGTAAHIHVGAAGQNGPVIVPLTKSGDTYNVPPGAKLSDEQMGSFKAGSLYVNVHSAANPNGEIRGQLK